MKKIVIWQKHACQNMVAMETSKLKTGSEVWVLETGTNLCLIGSDQKKKLKENMSEYVQHLSITAVFQLQTFYDLPRSFL